MKILLLLFFLQVKQIQSWFLLVRNRPLPSASLFIHEFPILSSQRQRYDNDIFPSSFDYNRRCCSGYDRYVSRLPKYSSSVSSIHAMNSSKNNNNDPSNHDNHKRANNSMKNQNSQNNQNNNIQSSTLGSLLQANISLPILKQTRTANIKTTTKMQIKLLYPLILIATSIILYNNNPIIATIFSLTFFLIYNYFGYFVIMGEQEGEISSPEDDEDEEEYHYASIFSIHDQINFFSLVASIISTGLFLPPQQQFTNTDETIYKVATIGGDGIGNINPFIIAASSLLFGIMITIFILQSSSNSNNGQSNKEESSLDDGTMDPNRTILDRWDDEFRKTLNDRDDLDYL